MTDYFTIETHTDREDIHALCSLLEEALGDCHLWPILEPMVMTTRLAAAVDELDVFHVMIGVSYGTQGALSDGLTPCTVTWRSDEDGLRACGYITRAGDDTVIRHFDLTFDA